MQWQWHQLNHMQIICTFLQTDNHASISSLNFYRPLARCFSWYQPSNSVRAVKADYRKAKIKTCLLCELLVLYKMRNYVGQRFGGKNLTTWQYVQTTWIIYFDYGIDHPA